MTTTNKVTSLVQHMSEITCFITRNFKIDKLTEELDPNDLLEQILKIYYWLIH